ncbi:toxin-antitoxin system YwqK family antitoxin [Myroides guanonis]|uniref:Antitoxin component YwqK of the YwqJK toxin-antitoxin module n=1 Tax=Myroides guanonis TaxID=1150112 RepID=A0A1I3P7H9_9FLAO|nr:hypothetical protein [Myroides guanonis]SFJ17389.1 Antitoxin component YwqK of the YwqJK toxin-antitoxin module [Myroides guanonis]
MKNNFLFSIALLSGTLGYAQVQKDTIWHDYLDQKTIKENATGYRFIKPISKDKFQVESYSLENVLISKGNTKTDDPNSPKYEGQVIYYQEGGKEMILLNAENGVPTGKVISKLLDGTEYVGEFREGALYDGFLVNEYYDCYSKLEAKDGQFLKATLFSKLNNSYQQVVTFKDNALQLEEVFDANGNLIASLTYDQFAPIEGVKYTFSHKPLSVASIQVYKDSLEIESTSFYSDGKEKIKTKTDGLFKDYTYFNKNGEVIGEFRNDAGYEYESPTYEGTHIEFNYQEGKQDNISQIITYVDNTAVFIRHFDENGILNQTITYREDGFSNSKIEYWNPDGSLKAKIEYAEDGYTPWEGTVFLYNTTSEYKAGELVEETTSYKNGKVFETKKDLKSTYYDKNGKVLGTLTYTKEDGYWSPLNGKSFTMVDDLITDEATYEKGLLKHSINYTISNGKKVLKTESFYENGELVKQITYHNNGEISKEETYRNYEQLFSKFYDSDGKLIGAFDHKNTDGTLLTFFDNDILQSIVKYNNGTKLYEKKYTQDYLDFSLNSLEAPKTYLQSEIDFLKEGKFYSKGELISTVKYKNGAPIEGTVYEDDDYSIVVTNYENGLKEGEEITFSKYDPTTITGRTVYHLGNKVFEETYEERRVTSRIPYENDIYHGEAIFFDENGDELSRLIFQNGEPFEGTRITNLYTSILTQTYKEGTLVSVTDVNIEGVLLYKKTKENEKSKTSSIQVFDDADGSLVYSYEMYEDTNLHGTVSYYENGKLQRQAKVNNGILESGAIAIQFNNYLYNTEETNEASYYTLNKKKNKTQYQLFNESDELLMEYEIKSAKNPTMKTPLFTPFTPDQLYPENDKNNSWRY